MYRPWVNKGKRASNTIHRCVGTSALGVCVFNCSSLTLWMHSQEGLCIHPSWESKFKPPFSGQWRSVPQSDLASCTYDGELQSVCLLVWRGCRQVPKVCVAGTPVRMRWVVSQDGANWGVPSTRRRGPLVPKLPSNSNLLRCAWADIHLVIQRRSNLL